MKPGEAVRAFHQLMSQPAPDTPQHGCLTLERWQLRRSLIEEEMDELGEAFRDGDHAAFLDACVDLVYVVVGTAVEAGLPFDKAFEAVHRANMAKAVECEACGGTGSVVWVSDPQGDEWGECDECAGMGRIVQYREDGKVTKPVGWQAPDIASLIWKEIPDARTNLPPTQ